MAYESESPLGTGLDNGETGTANLISSGIWTKAELASSADVDYFKVIVPGAGLLRLDFSSARVSVTPAWQVALLDASGDYLTQLSTTSLGTPVVSGNSNSGTTLLVSGLTSAVAPLSRFTLSTSGADTTIYTVLGATSLSGGTSTLTLDKALGGTPSASTPLVFAPAQDSVAGWSRGLTTTVTAAGTYFVEVRSSNWSGDEYQVRPTFVSTLESTASNDTKVPAAEAGNRLVPNAWMTGALSAQSDVDAWVFTTAAVTSNFHVDFSAASGDDSIPEWEVTLTNWSGDQPVTSVQNVVQGGSAGKTATYTFEAAKYSSPATFVVSVAAKSGVTYDPGAYKLRLRGDGIDLNDTPVITVDTRDSGAPNDYVETGVVRSLKAGSQVALKSLFSVSDPDATVGQTIAKYIVGLNPASGGSATAKIRIINADNSYKDYVNGEIMSAQEMANAYVEAGTTLGPLDLVIQALDSSDAADNSGASSYTHQTLRLVSDATGVTVGTDGTLSLVERATSQESGYSESLSVRLTSPPTHNVLIYLEQSDNQLSLSKKVLTFTPANYQTAQSVTVTAAQDSLTEGAHTGRLTFRVISEDPAYEGLAVAAQTFALGDPINHPAQGAVTLAGAARVGRPLQANVSALSDAEGLGEFTYRWERKDAESWTPIDGATTGVYTLTSGDVDKQVRVKVTYLDGLLNTETVTSSPSATVTVMTSAGYQLGGGVRHWKNNTTKITGVQFEAGGQTATSDSTGAFALEGLSQDSGDASFTLAASKTVTATRASEAGITLADVLAALKVYLNKPLTADINGYTKYIASDFDGNGTVNLTDVLTLLKYYLNKPTTVTPQWVFLEAAADGTVPFNQANAAFGKDAGAALPAEIIKDLSSPADDVQIVGILRGDVDGSWTPA